MSRISNEDWLAGIPVAEQPTMSLPRHSSSEAERLRSFRRRFEDPDSPHMLVRRDIEDLLLVSCSWIRELSLGSCVVVVTYDSNQWPGSVQLAYEAVLAALSAAGIASGAEDFAWEALEHAA